MSSSTKLIHIEIITEIILYQKKRTKQKQSKNFMEGTPQH